MVKAALSAAKQVGARAAATARRAVNGGSGGAAKTTAKATATTAAPAKKAAATKAPAKAAPAKKAPAKAAPAKKAPAKAAPAKKAPAKAAPAKKAPAKASALRVREDESPWTAEELAGVRAELEHDIAQLRSEISNAESDLVGLMRDSGDGAGDDQADAGAKTYEREQEISLANNAREMLEQTEHALERLEDGSYGICESCGNPIGKLRLQAAPRATLCMPCKMKQERR